MKPGELVLLRDRDWSAIDGAACRVTAFTPMARMEDGQVVALDKTLPYASIVFECDRLSQEARGFIGHRLDFEHLWRAFEDRSVGDEEEVIVFWTKEQLKRPFRLVSKFMPRLWVMVCPKGAFDLMTDSDFKPELTGQARWEALAPIAQWKPDVLE